MTRQTDWWAKGLLFENCNCQLVCPGHFHFTQLCTYDRCLGYWGIHFREGDFGGEPFGDLNTIIVFDMPQRMSDGNWILTTYIDERASEQQQIAIERIISGEANGPWRILAQFVKERKPSQRAKIRFDDTGREKTLTAGDFFRSTIGWLKGRDKQCEVNLVNSFNQIHDSTQTLNMGSTDYTDAPYDIHTKDTHSICSQFSWAGRT